jgi:hypothetical protein
MKLRGMTALERLILNFLYELRNTPMMPPDPRISHEGIERVLGIQVNDLSLELNALKKKGFILPLWIEGKKFYKITLAGVREIEKCMVTTVEGEVSTSRIGISGEKKQIK